MKYYTDRRAFGRRIDARRSENDSEYHGFDRRIVDRRRLACRRQFNRGILYRGIGNVHLSHCGDKISVMFLRTIPYKR